jgi:hypothetical protein
VRRTLSIPRPLRCPLVVCCLLAGPQLTQRYDGTSLACAVAAEKESLRPAAASAKQARRLCHRLAGAIRMVELTLPKDQPPPAPPPPPPLSWRRSLFTDEERRNVARGRALALATARCSRRDRGHLAEVRALLCLGPGSAQRLPLQPSLVRSLCDTLKLNLKGDGQRDLFKVWSAIAFASAPMPLPWKPIALGFQNTLTGAVSEVHPLCDAFRNIHRAMHDQPAVGRRRRRRGGRRRRRRARLRISPRRSGERRSGARPRARGRDAAPALWQRKRRWADDA